MVQVLQELSLPISFEELQQQAKQKLDKKVFDYIQSGSGKEETLQANDHAFKKWKIIPRYLTDVSKRNIETIIEGEKIAAPVLFAPIGMQGISHPDGELAVAKAAGNKGLPYIASTVSSYSLEEIAEANENGINWFQLYFPNDLELAKSLVQRAHSAGYKAIVITVDTNMLGYRERDRDNRYSPFKLGKGIGNYAVDPVFIRKIQGKNPDDFMEEMIKVFYRQNISWEDIAYIRQCADLPIYLKGILHPKDALLAKENGINGIIVSNHGGRQLDGAVASLDILPSIKEVVGDELTILLDGGIRRGSDIVKALALGADAVLYGRPYLYSLALGGKEGVEQNIDNLMQDLEITMALSGASAISELNQDLLWENN
ncbi:alpha-hydroxy-acid oxidizing protein [Aquibacillus halophilus]|uniref:L-lactate oxidase n=1 Tax=Aquibacillus halophilus TaxID=930132 RepID=A0A6A8D9S0_9BACI|nr:alpha-hydroxy-acid oxidizing protein [Aquibacillus halophilus]MRH42030.1 alpha-hydroxy-acid oxidizing protein [Aquibacillus halophilus]